MLLSNKLGIEIKPLSGLTKSSGKRVKPITRRNQHILMLNGKWCVHAELQKRVSEFANRESAIDFARKIAQEQKTEAILHRPDGTIETAWMYSDDAFPQEKIYAAYNYPLEASPGENVL
jgi:hypothetical protein